MFGPSCASMRKMKLGAMTCKVRHFLAITVSTIITSFILCLFSRQQPVNLHNLVSETTKQLEHLKENLQVVSKEKKFQVEDRLLSQLGFRKDGDNSSNFKNSLRVTLSQHGEKNESRDIQPIVVVSMVNTNQLPLVPEFLNNIHAGNVLPSSPIVLWYMDKDSDSDVETEFSISLKQLCNSSKCLVEKFNFGDYPLHVRDADLKAYRPLVIQTMLERGGCILWLDIDRRLIPLSKSIDSYLNLALNGGSNGIVGWSAGRPTSSLTHPKTFSYFQTDAENYYFHRMIDPAQLLVCNTEDVHKKIMLPWVECTLTKDCIDPFGAQSTGCRFDKKPLYRYSGCHGYDSSALNVALGLAFPRHQPYISWAPISRSIHQLSHNNSKTTKPSVLSN